jgi:hypothetical protein
VTKERKTFLAGWLRGFAIRVHKFGWGSDWKESAKFLNEIADILEEKK